jgi:hypothetical protein
MTYTTLTKAQDRALTLAVNLLVMYAEENGHPYLQQAAIAQRALVKITGHDVPYLTTEATR